MGFQVHPRSGRLRVGSTGATYEILGKLATGGMAEVFLARAGTSETVVVLKRILPHLAEDAEFVRMFRDEAHLALRLRHPNIVRAIDIGEGDEHFFTMEYVHGEDLRGIVDAARARGENIPLPHILTIALGLTAALHHTHEQTDEHGRPLHIVHRDVSPTNVLVGYDGTVKLVDFGVAKAAAGTHVTRAGTLKGKLAYMSPEQCRADEVDRRSDVFSVGILLYELTTLTRLFTGDNDIAVLHEVMQGVKTPPSTLRRGYPPALERIVLGALRTDLDARYPTAQAVHADLARFAEQMGIRPSEEALSRYLHGLFGERPLPWQDPSRPELGLVPRSRTDEHPTVATPRPALGEQERTEVAAVPGPLPGPLPAFASTSQAMMTSPAPAPPRRKPLLLGALATVVVGGTVVGVGALSSDPKTVAAEARPAPTPEPKPVPVPSPKPEPTPAPARAPAPKPEPELEIPPEFTRPPETTAPKPEFVLERVKGEGRERTATILLRDGSTTAVQLGDSVGTYRVVAVNEASVLLERNDGENRVTKRLEL